MAKIWSILYTLCVAHFTQTNIIPLNTIEELTAAQKKSSALVVKFYSPSCPACNEITQEYARMAADPTWKEVTFAQVNIKTAPAFRKAYNLKGIPTITFFKDNAQITSKIGANNFKTKLQSELNKHFGKKITSHVQNKLEVQGAHIKKKTFTCKHQEIEPSPFEDEKFWPPPKNDD